MANVTISTKVSGPFFQLKGQPLKDAMEGTIRDLLKEGEAKVEQQLYTGHGVRSGEYKSSLVQKFAAGRGASAGWGLIAGGKQYPNNIIGKWLEGGTKRNAATRFKGYAMFRKGAQHLRRVANEVAGKQYKRAVKRLT